MIQLDFTTTQTDATYAAFKSVAASLDPHSRGQLFFITNSWTDVNNNPETGYSFALIVDQFWLLFGATPHDLPAQGSEFLVLYPSAINTTSSGVSPVAK